jgi:hypothetical protein
MSRMKAILKYRRSFPNYCDCVRDGGLFGYGTHLETMGGEVISSFADELLYHLDMSSATKGLRSAYELVTSVVYSGILGFVFPPSTVEMLIETPIRKITGKTRF